LEIDQTAFERRGGRFERTPQVLAGGEKTAKTLGKSPTIEGRFGGECA
jgi:hypothetical protein